MTDPLTFIFVIAILIISIIVHEVAHGYAANFLGDPTARLAGRLTLNPLAHLDLVGSFIVPVLFYFIGGFVIGWAKPVPYNPYNFKKFQRWGDAIVAGAGPATNIFLALFFGLIVRFGMGHLPAQFLALSSLVVLINIVLACFNLVPIPPLDGSKILFTFLPDNFSRFRLALEQYGFFLVLIFILFFWSALVPIINVLFSVFTGSVI